MPDKHQWLHRYIAPVASGQAIPDIRPGDTIARCLAEIQSVVQGLKSDSNFSWAYPVRLPDGNPINIARPGQYYAQAIREIQDTLDGLSGAVSAALVKSYSEHRQALGQSAYDYDDTPGSGGDWVYRVPVPAPGQIIHASRPGLQLAFAITEIQNYIDGITMDQDLAEEMQIWLEANCTSFIDHVDGPLTPARDAFLYFTLETWRAAAGIDGSWLPGDLEKGFNALLWTIKRASVAAIYGEVIREYKKALGVDLDCETAKTECINIYNAAAWSPGYEISGATYAVAVHTYVSFSTNVWLVIRQRCKVILDDMPKIKRINELYALPSQVVYGNAYDFVDLDNIGATLGKWLLYDTLPESSETMQESDYFGDIATSPIDLAGLSCPINYVQKGMMFSGIHYAIQKWSFTTA